jgi:hypothetical protein
MIEAAYGMMVLVGALAFTFVAAWLFERRESKQTIRGLKVTNESIGEYMNKKLADMTDSRDAWIARGKANAAEVSKVLDGSRKDVNDARKKIVDLTNERLEMIDALLMHDDHVASIHGKHIEAMTSTIVSLSSHVTALRGRLHNVKVRAGELSGTINRTFQRIASELEPEGLEVLASCAEDLKNPGTGRWISSEIRDAARAAQVSDPTVTKTKEEFYL